MSFHGFALNCEYYPANHGLVDQQYESTKNATMNFLLRIAFYHSKRESFPPQMFCRIQYSSALMWWIDKLKCKIGTWFLI